MAEPPLKNFRDSPWRYVQFVVVGLVVAALVKWLGPFGWGPSLAIGAAVAIAYLLFEKKRGAI